MRLKVPTIALAAVTVLFIGCDGETSVPTGLEGGPIAGAKGGTPGPPGGGGGDDGGGGSTEDPSLAFTFSDRVGDEITSDGRGAYVDGECNVGASLNLGDAILNLKGRVDRKNCDDPKNERVVRLSGFPESSPGGSEREGRFLNVDGQPIGTEIQDLRDMPLGTVMETQATFGAEGCALQLKFAEDLGGDWVEIIRDTQTTWTVRSKASPDNRAVCLDSDGNVKFGGPLHLDFQVTIEQLP